MAKLDKIKLDNPDLNKTIIDVIRSVDPSSTNKYCEFLIKMIKTDDNYQEAIVKSLISGLFGVNTIGTLHKFEEHSKANRIPLEYRDISAHNDWRSIEKAVEIADNIVKRKQLEKETKKIYENDEWVVLIPESFEASQLYAYNTKWCITQKSYWNDYKKHSRIIYVINKKTDDKCAISKRFGSSNNHIIQGWDAKDNETSPFVWEFTDEIWKIIRNDLRKSRPQHELDEIEDGYIFINTKGDVVKLEEANLNALEWFYKKYGTYLNEPLKEQVLKLGTKLREEDNINKAKVKEEIKNTSRKTISENDVREQMRWSGYDTYFKDDMIKELLDGFYYTDKGKEKW